MAYSDAQKEATARYNKKTYDFISVVVPKGKRKRIAEYAASQGKSMNRFINDAIDAQLDTGAVKVSGVLWTAKCPSCARIETGAHVKILRVEGAKLLVEPVEVPVNIR